MIGIRSAAFHLGSELHAVASWCDEQFFSEKEKLLQSGTRTFYKIKPKELWPLAVRAMEDALQQSQIRAEDVDLLIFCHTSQCNIASVPLSTAGFLKEAGGLTKARAFSISQQNCVSPIHALRLLDQLFTHRQDLRSALIVTMDNIILEQLRPIGTGGMQSDGASAMVVTRSAEAGNRIVSFESLNDMRSLVGIHQDGRYEENNQYLWSTISILRQIMKKAGVSIDELTTICPQNSNLPSWQQTLRVLKIPEDKLYKDALVNVGHALGSDIAINLASTGALHKPGCHLVFSSGIGGCFGALMLKTNGRQNHA